jgi:hypothetical protein
MLFSAGLSRRVPLRETSGGGGVSSYVEAYRLLQTGRQGGHHGKESIAEDGVWMLQASRDENGGWTGREDRALREKAR